jgi:4a-hydroxytetrahydrobiopterin dehydratase
MGSTSPEPLGPSEIAAALSDLPGWEHVDNALRKEFRFGSFREAMSFLVRVAFEAEQRNHHPEIENVYNRVVLTLRTHDAGGEVTVKDVDLARAVESFSWV